MKERKKGSGGAKLSRTQTVTVRLDPRLRYLAELAARKQRRTLSSYIEWAIEESLHSVLIQESEDDDGISIAESADSLWDVDESDRFAKLAINHPELLTHDEQIKWKLISECGYVWRRHFATMAYPLTWDRNLINLDFERLREIWTDILAVAEGTAKRQILPSFEEPDKMIQPGIDPYR